MSVRQRRRLRDVSSKTASKATNVFRSKAANPPSPIIDELLDRAAHGNVDECVIGMAHRGRLTMLANVIGKGIAQVFSEFEGEISEDDFEGSGDVKYHLGASNRRQMPGGKAIRVSVAPNPSHLEAVNPVVEGIVRPKQDRLDDQSRERVIPLLIHGDAAMAGQGIVAETLNLSQIDGYNTGGTIHLVINNQIGFTTNPSEARSTGYCSDVALMVHAPVFHVNGDDPEACIRAAQMAYDFRQRFHRDVVIDMLCWRKHGHNEGDDASYTQPVLYRKLKDHKSVAALYGARLQKEGVITARRNRRLAGSAEEVSLRYLRSDADEQGRVGTAGAEPDRARFHAAGSAAHRREPAGARTGDPRRITEFPAGFQGASEADASGGEARRSAAR